MAGMKKRSFLLLEVLIAFLLVAICSVTLVRQPLLIFSSEMKALEQMERERLAEWTYTEVKESLLKLEIPWEKLPGKNNKTQPISLPSATIEIPGCKPKTIERSFVLSCMAEKTGLQEEIYRNYHLFIDFSPPLSKKKPDQYKFRIQIQKKKQNSLQLVE